jgi:hypothetical protein
MYGLLRGGGNMGQSVARPSPERSARDCVHLVIGGRDHMFGGSNAFSYHA